MNSRLEKLKQQREQLEARIKQAESQDRTRERKQDTRRKVLLGALLSEWMEKDEALRKKVYANLERYLVRKVDRDVFGLPTLTEAPADPSQAVA